MYFKYQRITSCHCFILRWLRLEHESRALESRSKRSRIYWTRRKVRNFGKWRSSKNSLISTLIKWHPNSKEVIWVTHERWADQDLSSQDFSILNPDKRVRVLRYYDEKWSAKSFLRANLHSF